MLKNKLDGEVKEVKKQIQGIKNNLESIVDIVKVSYEMWNQYLGLSKSFRANKKRKIKDLLSHLKLLVSLQIRLTLTKRL